MTTPPADPRPAPAPTTPSRRAFLKGTGLSAAAGLVGVPGVAALSDDGGQKIAASPAFGPAPVSLSLTVNGQKLETAIEPRVTLLDALRDFLDHTSPKRVCDRGTCGACTVIADGKPIYSCMTLALEARGKKIDPAEGFGDPDGRVGPVPAAFVKHDAQQCGFCTPGFVVAMKATLDKNPKATPGEVEVGLCGNICRCGTYQQMREAIRDLRK